jgi:N-acyl-D-aspartate/D-glutamate deacylase
MPAMFAPVFLALLAAAAPPAFDVLIRGGRIVDGAGNPSFVADIGIRDGRIAAIGALANATAARTIGAAGLTVAPGFVDIHNHSDETLLADGGAESMVRQGVTSMVLGEGGSASPSARFPGFQDYFTALLRGGIATNVGSYVGSSTVWTTVRGPRAGPPTRDELDRMRALVKAAMEQGALGLSSSLSGPPGSWIDTDTLVALAREAGAYGGSYSTHIRNEGLGVWEAVAEALDIGRRARVPVDVIHLKIAEHTLWKQMPKLAGVLAEARAAGLDVTANVYPYRAGQNALETILPPWAHEGGTPELLARLRDPAARARLAREITEGLPGWYNHYTATGSWDGMLLVSLSAPEYERFEGRRMSEVIAAFPEKRPLDVLFDTLIANGGHVPTVYFHHAEEDMQHALRQPFVSVGSDGTAVRIGTPTAAGNPHPRYYGTFARVLGRYVRELKVLTVEEAVRKMTSANTAKIGVFDRGLLRPGQWADVTVFDPARVADHATFENPHQYATGIEYVLVNGQVVLENGRPTGARPGRILRRSAPGAAGPQETDQLADLADPHPRRRPHEEERRQGGGGGVEGVSGGGQRRHDLSWERPAAAGTAAAPFALERRDETRRSEVVCDLTPGGR